MSMSMFEMYFADRIDPQKLCDAIAKHLFVRREDVGVVPITLIDTKNPAVVIDDIGGDFPYGVTVHAELTWLPVSEAELAQKLCTTLHTQCLIADDGDNPYQWILISRTSSEPVLVNPELFDGQCIFKIEGTL